MAKTFKFVLKPMLTDIISTAGALGPIVQLVGEIYRSTPAVLSLHGREVPMNPTWGMKEVCPLSLTLFLLSRSHQCLLNSL